MKAFAIPVLVFVVSLSASAGFIGSIMGFIELL
jgi:hypothetical protein